VTFNLCLAMGVVTILLEECEDDIHILKMGTCESIRIWESIGALDILEFNYKDQNTLHLCVLYIIGKLLKCRC
jgi:hypothetical protein